MWDVASGAVLAEQRGSPQLGGYCRGAWSPDESEVLVSTRGGAQIWDAATNELLVDFAASSGYGVAAFYGAAGPRLVTGSAEGTAWLWDVESGTPLGTFAGHADHVLAAALTPDGGTLVTGSYDGTARIWNVAAGTLETALGDHGSELTAVAISPDGSLVATGTRDARVRVFDRAAGDTIWSSGSPNREVTCLAFSADGTRLAAGSADDRARVWNAQTGHLRRTVDHGDDVESLCFCADGSMLATGGRYAYGVEPIPDSLGRIWDLGTGERLETLSGHFSMVFSVAFSADGTRVMTVGGDMAVCIWDWTDDAPRVPGGLEAGRSRGKVGRVIDWTARPVDDEGGPLDVTWSFGDGSTAVGEDVSHAWEEKGVYRVSATVSDGATTVTETRRYVVGTPSDPRVEMRIDHRRESRDKLKLKLLAPLDLPAEWTSEGAELEVLVTAVLDDVDLRAGTTVVLDARGKAKDDGVKVKLLRKKHGDWKLKVTLARRDFEMGDGSAGDVEAWSDHASGEDIPVTVRVLVDGVPVWTTSGIHRYKSRENRKGKIRR
jgi:hypothetical protein